MNTLWIILAIIAIITFIIIGIYNSLIKLKNEVKNSEAQIDVQLKRRNDLIPNLVNTVKGYMKHEKGVLETITKARSAVMQASNVKDKANASNMLSNTLKSLFAVTENYPDLKANQNFIQLQEEITGTENKISYSRQHFNDMVMEYNNQREVFPKNVIANMFNFGKKESFEATTEEKKNVKVEF